MTTMGPDLDKAALRAAAAETRREAQARFGAKAATCLAERFPFELAAPGVVVAGYWPIGTELDPIPLMTRLAGHGCTLCLPVVLAKDRPLAFRRWRPGDPLVGGPYRTSHPAPEAGEVLPDLILAPMLAFDDGGARLGYGGGYYDRTLASLRASRPVLAIGLAFAAQRVDKVPEAGLDQKLDWIVTEAGAHRVER